VQDDFKVTSRLALNVGLRYEYTPFDSGYKGQLGTFDGTSSRPIIVASHTDQPDLTSQPSTQLLMARYGNLIQTSTQAGLPYSITYTDKKQVGPRFGMAWRPLSGIVVRGGYGIFYESTSAVNRAGGGGVIPYYLEETVTQTAGTVPQRTLANFFLGQALGSAQSAPSFVPTKTRLPMGYHQHWNFGVQKSLAAQTVLEAYYVGNHAVHQMAANEYFNLPQAGAGAVQGRRPFPAFGSLYYFASGAATNYQALQAKVERRLSAGLWFLGSYTFSKTLVWQPVPGKGGNTAWEHSLNSSDIPQNVTVSGGYALPVGRSKRFLAGAGRLSNAVLGGWQIQSIFTARSGLPFTPSISGDVANIGMTGQRPNRIASGDLAEPSLTRWFDTTAFTLPAAYTYGNSGANILRGPSLKTLDCSVFKEFAVTERSRLHFRAEFFNLTNTPSFLNPSGIVDSASGARITATSTTPRQIQFALRYSF
jgi:hypothetical protein